MHRQAVHRLFCLRLARKICLVAQELRCASVSGENGVRALKCDILTP